MSDWHNVHVWLRQNLLRGVWQHEKIFHQSPFHTSVRSEAVQPQVQLFAVNVINLAGPLQAVVAAAAAAVREEVEEVQGRT